MNSLPNGFCSCRDCVQEHTKDDGDRKRNLGERDLLAGLLDIDSIVCTAAKGEWGSL